MSLSKSAKQVHGFTLIELLIVVAIIAILAAIAVPNFLEAQTRAKVARVQSDERSLATALESYAVDNKGYPMSDMGQGNLVNGDYKQVAGLPFWMNFLTSPSSYITALPYDVFSKSTIVPPRTTAVKDRFKLYSGNGLGDGATGQSGRYTIRTAWALVSVGPLAQINLSATPPIAGDYTPKFVKNLGADPTQSFFFMYIKDDGLKGVGTNGVAYPPYPTACLVYDSTNGTSSNGHIVKTGGSGAQYFTTPDYDNFKTNP
jgi:type II secretion system protein G